ncbi:hypothetical protein [Methylobacterium frigidaeris]|uniref:Uncharacterized protein n=1 Tax=Methylobacterium frigidaeris TaxID=2038277 RepID=A0AA37HE56_9HYPH|nr:hypothetical protein [Methylobacterium frigidaeris]PIK68652.1 hypothetical protein CS379_33900 [Methylobacterium frigidaeris]GJD64093.1 hypothetical protein MPEAHAMD_4267 [Methylobacterium frigidaeris]
MTMAPTQSRPLDMLDASQQKPLQAPLGARDLADGTEAVAMRGDSADQPDVFCPAVVSIEDQRARAQQEFKRIWDLCTLTH